MGSFTEIVVAFSFRPDAPIEILSAFSDWQDDGDPELPVFDELVAAAPPLPDVLEDRLMDFPEGLDEEALAGMPVIHQARVLAGLCHTMWTAYFPGSPSTQMVRSGPRWNLTTRAHHKTTVAGIRPRLATLGAFTCPDASRERPAFVGYLKYEGDANPVLVWHRGGSEFEFDDPNLP